MFKNDSKWKLGFLFFMIVFQAPLANAQWWRNSNELQAKISQIENLAGWKAEQISYHYETGEPTIEFRKVRFTPSQQTWKDLWDKAPRAVDYDTGREYISLDDPANANMRNFKSRDAVDVNELNRTTKVMAEDLPKIIENMTRFGIPVILANNEGWVYRYSANASQKLEIVDEIEANTDLKLQRTSTTLSIVNESSSLTFKDSEGRQIVINVDDRTDVNRAITSQSRKNLVVITDVEPDDRIALNLLATQFGDRLKFIGTTVMHAVRKAELVRSYMNELGLSNIPVIVGTGGHGTDYPDIASSRAAREYEQEGRGILSQQELDSLNNPNSPRGSKNLQQHLEATLKKAANSNFQMEIVLLAPPTDLVAVLNKYPYLKRAISRIHVMGGWVDAPAATAGAEPTKRSTYNWNMDPVASSQLMAISGIPMTLYSSHIIKPSFAGGSISQANHPEIINVIESSNAPSLRDFRTAGYSWDHHLMEKIPPLAKVIGSNAGRQFTPADPLVVAAMINPAVITATVPVAVNIDLNDVDPARGYKVNVSEYPSSQIRLVTAVDASVFASVVTQGLQTVELNWDKNPHLGGGSIGINRCEEILKGL